MYGKGIRNQLLASALAFQQEKLQLKWIYWDWQCVVSIWYLRRRSINISLLAASKVQAPTYACGANNFNLFELIQGVFTDEFQWIHLLKRSWPFVSAIPFVRQTLHIHWESWEQLQRAAALLYHNTNQNKLLQGYLQPEMDNIHIKICKYWDKRVIIKFLKKFQINNSSIR